LTHLLQCNPFDASLCVSDIKQRLEEEKVKLAELMPKDDAEERTQKWNETVKAFREFLESEQKDENDKVGGSPFYLKQSLLRKVS